MSISRSVQWNVMIYSQSALRMSGNFETSDPGSQCKIKTFPLPPSKHRPMLFIVLRGVQDQYNVRSTELQHLSTLERQFLLKLLVCLKLIVTNAVSVWQPTDVRKNKTTQSWHVTGFAARRQTMEPLEFLKTGKKRRLKRQTFCFCGVTIVSSTVFERKISCQHVDVNMRMLRFFSVEKPGVIPRWGQSVSDRDFHTCLFFMYDSLLL